MSGAAGAPGARSAPRPGGGFLKTAPARWALLAAAAVLLCLVLPAVGNGYVLRVATTLFLYAALGQAWNFIGGYTGYPAFGNVVFWGAGGYATAVVMTRGGPFALGLAVSAAFCAAFAAAIGFAVLRLRGHYFAIATLGVAEATREIVVNLPALGAAGGLSLPIERNAALFYYLGLVAVVALGVLTWVVERTRPGYAFVSIRENEQAAEALGIDTLRYKVLAFAMSAAATGVIGGINAYWSTFIDPESSFSPGMSVAMILVCLLGGAATVAGPLVGATLYVLATAALLAYVPYGHDTLLGLLIAVVVLVLPRGLLSLRFGKGAPRPTSGSLPARGVP